MNKKEEAILQAEMEVAQEEFREAVEREKQRLREEKTKKSLLKRLFPYRIKISKEG